MKALKFKGILESCALASRHSVLLGSAIALLMVFGLAGLARGEAAGQQSWKARGGHELVAEFIGIKNGEVLLKDADGNVRNIRLAALEPEYQELAKELAAKAGEETAAATEQKSSNALPVFASGPHKNNHAVYTHPNFIARVKSDTTVHIQCLEDGKPVGKPVILRTYHYYYETAKNKEITRKIVSFDAVPQPTDSPDVLVFEGLLEDNVRFGFGIEFKSNTVQGWSWIVDPPGLAKPTRLIRYFRLAPSHTFEPHVLVADQKKELEPFALSVKPTKGKTVDYPYGEIAKGWPESASAATIKGPIFGSRKLTFTHGRSRIGTMRPWIYSSYAPYQGYQVRLYKSDLTSRDDKCRIILTID